MVLARHLERHPDSVVLQIGAFDGRKNDPLHEYITRYHLRGVLVEPMPDAFATLKDTYRLEPRVRLENVAISHADGTRPLFYIRRDAPELPAWAPMLASFDRDVLLRHAAQIPHIAGLSETTDVTCLTLQTLLERTGLERVDILQIDVEGWDYEVLKQVDFRRMKPAVINYEHAHLGADDADAAIALLVGNGYDVGIGPYDTVAYLTALGDALS